MEEKQEKEKETLILGSRLFVRKNVSLVSLILMLKAKRLMLNLLRRLKTAHQNANSNVFKVSMKLNERVYSQNFGQ